MARINTSASNESFFNVSHAAWVSRVLNMLIAVVGRDSLLGTILRQTRSEIASLAREEQPNDPAVAKAACYSNN